MSVAQSHFYFSPLRGFLDEMERGREGGGMEIMRVWAGRSRFIPKPPPSMICGHNSSPDTIYSINFSNFHTRLSIIELWPGKKHTSKIPIGIVEFGTFSLLSSLSGQQASTVVHFLQSRQSRMPEEERRRGEGHL